MQPAARLRAHLAELVWPLLAVAASVLVLTLALLRPAPYTVEVGEPGDAYALANFHRPEGSFRWSAPGALLLIPAVYDGPLALALRLHGPPTATPAAQTLRIERDNTTVAAVATTGEWRVYRVLLPPDGAPEAAGVELETLALVAPPTQAPGDQRPLGVAVDELALAAVEPAAAPLWPALRRAITISWALWLGWSMVWLAVGRRPQKAALWLLGAGAALALWAWRAPLSFAWGVPEAPWWLLGAGSLGAVALAQFYPQITQITQIVSSGRTPAARQASPASPPAREASPAGSPRVVSSGRTPAARQASPASSPPVVSSGRTPAARQASPASPPAREASPAGSPQVVSSGRTPAAGEAGSASSPGVTRGLVLALGALVGSGLIALLLPAPWAGAGALVLVLLPGALAALALFPEERGLAARVMLASCGALAVAALGMLALHALPGPPPGWLLLGVCLAGTAALGGAMVRQRARTDAHLPARAPVTGETPTGLSRLVLLALLVGAALRLWQLGGAEFQGDEARAMLLALGVARGDDGLLLTHTKGPVEALLPATLLVVVGAAPEWAARLPFALASLGVLAGALALMERFAARDFSLHPSAFILPLALLAVDGFAVAFGRIVQYQSVVMLMMTGAFWCCWRFYAGAERSWRHLVVAAVLLAVGLLAHYDAVLVAPALGWLVVAGGLRRGWRGATWARGLGAPAALGAFLLGSFYLPYFSSASFAATADYLAGRAAEGDAGGPPFNNLGIYSQLLAFYSGPPLMPLVVGLVAGAVALLLVLYVKPRALGVGLAAGFVLAALGQWLAPAVFELPGGGSWAIAAFGLPLAGLCCLPGVPGQVRAVAIWFAAAFVAQAFLIAEPRTHFYTAHVPAALLVGLAAAGAQARVASQSVADARVGLWRLARALPAVVGVAVLAGGGLYGQLAYLRQLPEYQRSYPAARPAWLRGSFGDTLPEGGYFGFPHRDGWKAVAELFRSGALAGSYDTNQNRWLAGWYLGGLAQQCKGQPELYLIAEGEPTVYFPPGYYLRAQVTVGPGRALAIYGREPPAGAPLSVAAEALAPAFDRRPALAAAPGALLNAEPPRCP